MLEAGEWERLARLLDDDEVAVLVVREAITQGNDPWEALLDGLDEAGALAYLRSDDTGMELTDALAQLPRVFAAQPDLDDATDVDELADATRIADGLLTVSGLRILRLVEGDESWPVVVVPADRVGEVIALASALGAEIRAAE